MPEGEMKAIPGCPHCCYARPNCIKHDDKVHPYRVTCPQCGCGTAYHGDFQQAWKAWRLRPAPIFQPADVEAAVAAVFARIEGIPVDSDTVKFWMRSTDPEYLDVMDDLRATVRAALSAIGTVQSKEAGDAA
jgi:hypothetical protein